MRFDIKFNGHKNIRSTHKNTIEITKDPNLTINGDCIIGVDAGFSCKDLPKKLKTKIKNSNSKIKFSIKIDGKTFIVNGKGHPRLSLSHAHDIVLRKSSFICPRTIAINCNKASDSIPKHMLAILQNPKTKGILTIEVN